MKTENKTVIEGATESNPTILPEGDMDRMLVRKIDWRVMPVVSLDDLICI
jgi:hypothetical protein